MRSTPRFLPPGAVNWRVIIGLGILAGVVVAAVAIKVFFFGPAPEGPPGKPGVPPEEDQLTVGKQRYASHCAACHGDQGDGNGPAARYLYPRPRDFGERKYRLASTTNGIPTDDDLLGAITRGMPGSAMFPFGHLPEADRQALVVYVRHLMRSAVERKIRQELDVGPEEVERLLTEMLTPGELIEPPETLPASSPASIARGKELYVKAACVSCHGETGKGDGVQNQHNDDGMPTRPRDFTQGIFKGSRDPRQLYARIMGGMAGSPMQSAREILQPGQVGDLINYVLSLSDPKVAALVEHQRTRIKAGRVGQLPGAESGDAAWGQAPAVPIVVSPLWWRDHVPVDLRVQALHDGQTLAVRLTWKDETRNAEPVRTQDFEDMAALQLYPESPEPFLGMGTGQKPVDVWHWRPRREQKPGALADVDTTFPNMVVDWYPFERQGEGPRAHGPERQPRDFIAAWAAGNPLTDPDRPPGGGNLQAGGFGTLTMRPSISQVVNAHGDWKDGRWTVVLSRPLKVEEGAGVPLRAGERVSIAFAIWDGTARDRNGQKLVSIWHDLELE